MNDKINGLGDQGQRYEVHARRASDQVDVVFGWTNSADGGRLMQEVLGSYRFHGGRIVDRWPGIENILEDWTAFKAGCRKCLEQLFAGRDVCPYCHMRFPLRRMQS